MCSLQFSEMWLFLIQFSEMVLFLITFFVMVLFLVYLFTGGYSPWKKEDTLSKEYVPAGSNEKTSDIDEHSDIQNMDANKTNINSNNILLLKKEMTQLSEQVQAQANEILALQPKHEQQPKSTPPQQLHDNIDFVHTNFVIMKNFIRKQQQELEMKEIQMNKIYNIIQEMKTIGTVPQTMDDDGKGGGCSNVPHLVLSPTNTTMSGSSSSYSGTSNFSSDDSSCCNDSSSLSVGGGSICGANSSFSCCTATTFDNDDDDDCDDDDDVVDDDDTCCNNDNMLIDNNKVLILHSSMPGNLRTSISQSKMEIIFREGLGLSDTSIDKIDGCDTTHHEFRNDLFALSGHYAVYPQAFLWANNDLHFLGDFDTIQNLHDARILPQKIGLEII